MELKELMQSHGIIGAGGAGFPSYAKLMGGADTLLINGSECEPLIYTDYVILKNELDNVIFGVTEILNYLSIPRAIIAVKAHTAKRLSFTDAQSISDKISIKVLPDVYPIGDEISLIYQSLGRVVRPGELPITKGVIVYNVETVYNVAKAIRYDEPVIKKWLTVGGNIDTPCVVRVPIGTKVSELLSELGITVRENESVIDGGPSMGKIINPSVAVVRKNTNAILILPNNIQAVASKLINEKMSIARAETACCQCTRCTDMCPRALLGYPLEPHKMVRTAMGAAVTLPEMVISATLCCSCGICETVACSQGISPRAVINNYKSLLAKNKLRYRSTADVTPDSQRDYRMVPSERWASMLGVRLFDKVAEYRGEINSVRMVEIPFSMHIGAPAIPAVVDGQDVHIGEEISRAADGLSVSHHASVSGKAYVTKSAINIIADR